MKKVLAFAMAVLLVLASFTFLASAKAPAATLTGTPSAGKTAAAALSKDATLEYTFSIAGYKTADHDGYGIGAFQVEITWDKDILEITNLVTAPDTEAGESYVGYVPLTGGTVGTLRASGVTTAVNPETGKVSDGKISIAYTYSAPAANPERAFYTADGNLFKLQFKVISDTKAAVANINVAMNSFGYVKSDSTPVELKDDVTLTMNPIYINKIIPKLAAPASLAWSGTSAQWGKVANASSYTIQLYKNGAADGSPISYAGTSDATQTYDLKTVMTGAVGTKYTFTVTAVGDTTNYKNSDASAKSAEYTVPDLPQFKTPTGLTWDAKTAKWTAVSQTTDNAAATPASYSIELFRNNVSVTTVTATTTSYDFTSSLTKGGSYTFKVTAVTDDGVARRSSAVSAASAANVIVPPALAAPTGLTWTGKTAGWTAVANASSYTVQLKLNGTNVGTPIAVAAGTSVDLTDKMTEAGDYTFTVMAVGDGESYSNSVASSTVATAVTNVPAPTGLTITDAGMAVWSPVSNAAKYKVQLFKNGTAVGAAIDTGAATQYDFSAQMKENGKYTFTVVAYAADPANFSSTATSAAKTVKPAAPAQASGIIFLPLYMKYTITYHANDGVVKNIIVTPGDRLNTNQTVAENTFTNGTKTFVEWNTKQDGKGTSYAPGDKILVNQNYHLFAIWK